MIVTVLYTNASMVQPDLNYVQSDVNLDLASVVGNLTDFFPYCFLLRYSHSWAHGHTTKLSTANSIKFLVLMGKLQTKRKSREVHFIFTFLGGFPFSNVHCRNKIMEPGQTGLSK